MKTSQILSGLAAVAVLAAPLAASAATTKAPKPAKVVHAKKVKAPKEAK